MTTVINKSSFSPPFTKFSTTLDDVNGVGAIETIDYDKGQLTLRGFRSSPSVTISLIDVDDNGATNEKYIEFTALPVPGSIILDNLADTNVSLAVVGDQLVFDGINWINSPNQSSLQLNILIGVAGPYVIGSVPAGAIIRSVSLEIITPYSAGALIELGDFAISDVIMASSANDPQAQNIYYTMPNTSYVAITTLLATIIGAPAAGSGRVIIDYVL